MSHLSKSNPPRLRTAMSAALLVAGLSIAASPAMARKAPVEPANRGLESIRQPVVQRTDFTFDTVADGYGGLSGAEKRRMADWFDAIGLGYGDRVSVANDGYYGRGGVNESVAALVARYGLLIAEDAPVTAGQPGPGAIRVVVSRATASVPGCPYWNDRAEADYTTGTPRNYGCATNGNLAAMIADPEDLVRGRETRSDLRTATSSRAIKAYRDAAPSGAGGGLK